MNEKRLGMEKFSNNRKKGNKKRAVQEPLKLRRKCHLTDFFETEVVRSLDNRVLK